MHAIDALVSGIRGAELGSVRLYRRGTSTPATWYADFEASSANSTGDAIALDSNGGVEVYVNELVDVRVFDVNGTTVREFIAGSQAYAVEVISQSFTGTDYQSGQTGTSRPTDVGTVLDRWLTSAGAADWEVLFSGSAARLQDALGAIYGLFYNVKSPEFGAVGDGATDDTAAWQAAHDAALAAGGGVVVAPPGQYNLSASLDWKTGVSCVVIPDTVTLRMTNTLTTITGTSSLSSPTTTPTVFYGLRFDSTVSNGSTQVQFGHTTAEEVQVLNCYFGGSSNATGAGVVVGGPGLYRLLVRACVFQARADVRQIYDTRNSSTSATVDIEKCQFYTPAAAYSTALVRSDNNALRITDCDFWFQSTSGTATAIDINTASKMLLVSGCNFETLSGSSTNYAVRLLLSMRARVDDSNYFTGVTRYLQAAATDLAEHTRSYLAMGSASSGGTTGTTHTVPDWTRSYVLTSTNVAAPTVTLPHIAHYGQQLDLVIKNNSAANWGATSPTLVGDTVSYFATYDAVSPNLNIGRCATVRLVAGANGANIVWFQIGAWANVN